MPVFMCVYIYICIYRRILIYIYIQYFMYLYLSLSALGFRVPLGVSPGYRVSRLKGLKPELKGGLRLWKGL